MTLSGWSLICLSGTALLHAIVSNPNRSRGKRLIVPASMYESVLKSSDTSLERNFGSTRNRIHAEQSGSPIQNRCEIGRAHKRVTPPPSAHKPQIPGIHSPQSTTERRTSRHRRKQRWLRRQRPPTRQPLFHSAVNEGA